MSAALTGVRPYVLPDVANCPMPIVDQAIVRAAIRFCAKTGVWRYTHATQAVVEATVAYSFAPPAGAKVERVLAAWLDGQPLTVKNATDLLGVADWTTETGTPKYLVVLSDSQFRVYPLGAGDVDMEVTLKPARAATTIDDNVFETHVEAIASGALEILLAKPGKPWSKPEHAAHHKGKFEEAIADAEIHEYRHAPIRTARPPL
jgi:hypothetical protein